MKNKISKQSRLVLGIDPGSQRTGFGFLEVFPNRLRMVSYGVIQLPKTSDLGERLGVLQQDFCELLKRFQPEVAALEKIFLSRNVDSAFKLGHARGVLLAGCHQGGVAVVEYAARAIKKAVTGSGGADKDQVARLVQARLQIHEKLPPDAADALALALVLAFSDPGRRPEPSQDPAKWGKVGNLAEL